MGERKYQIESNEGDQDEAETLADARYRAGVMILKIQASLRDAQVWIAKLLGRPRRWAAKLTAAGAVLLTELYTDSLDVPAEKFRREKAQALAGLIDREERRRQRKRAEREQDRRQQRDRSRKYGRGVARPVICLSTDPPRWFDQMKEAAVWIGVKHPSMHKALTPSRRGKPRLCGSMRFAYADQCAAEIVAAAKKGAGK